MNYYNDFDKGAASWLRELIKAKLIPDGVVDERSITEVTPADLAGFTQCHFFCGIGGWPLALQLAGVPATQPLWTGSPPCQPFSVAGKQLGRDDPRHLAPAFLELIAQCRPQLLFGEQVAAAIGKHWLDALLIELEEQGYTCGAAVLPACSVGAPHKRDRLFFGASLGNANSERHYGVDALLREDERQRRERSVPETSRSGEVGALADALCEQRNRGGHLGAGRGSESPDSCHNGSLAHTNSQQQRSCGSGGACADDVPARREQDTATASGLCSDSSMADANGRKPGNGELQPSGQHGQQPQNSSAVREAIRGQRSGDETDAANPHNGFWSDADWLGCRDGKFRPVEAWTQQMVDGISDSLGCSSDPSFRKAFEEVGFPLGANIPARVARLRGYGNAIVPQVAAEFVKAFRGSIENLF